MIWFKCLVVGAVALLIAVGIGFFMIPLVLRMRTGQLVGWDITSFARHYMVWLVLGLAFAVGFLWEYRRLKN